jgi:hypothetical protein
MKRPLALLSACLLVLFGACAGPTKTRGVPAPELAELEKEKIALNKERRNFRRVLLQLDQAMDSYVTAMANRGDPRADHQVDRISKLLQDVVLDINGSDGKTQVRDHVPGENYRTLKALAADSSLPDQQAIALAALGFSDDMTVMPLILQGAQLSDPFLVDRAVLGLAVLKCPGTPPGVLAAIIEDPKHPEDGRAQAAWALYQVQTSCLDQTEIAKIWRRFLDTEQGSFSPSVIITAVRGLGLTGDPQHIEAIVPMLKHPTPRLRMAAAVALGRMNAQEHWKDLLELLKPQESNPNVRLSARKALARLAGDKDYSYDISAWQRVFERGTSDKQ